MFASILVALQLAIGANTYQEIKKIGERIWYEAISPDYDNEVRHIYELSHSPLKLPYKNVRYFFDQSYSGKENRNKSYDTISTLFPDNRKTVLNEAGYVVENWATVAKTMKQNDSIAYSFYPNGLLQSMSHFYKSSPGSNYTWTVEYDDNKLIKRHILRKMNGRLIAERTFDYFPAEHKIYAKTTYGKNNILEDAVYRYDSKGRLVTIERNAFLTNRTGKTTIDYQKNGYSHERSIWYDSTGNIVEDVKLAYRKNRLVERSNFSARLGAQNAQAYFYKYTKNGRLKRKEFFMGTMNHNISTYNYVLKRKTKECWTIENRFSEFSNPQTGIHIKIQQFY